MKKQFLFSLKILFLCVSVFVNAQERESQFYLLATSDQVQLLNQKMEYHVEGKKSLQIGNLLISNENLNINLTEDRILRLEAPLQFMIGGQLILKDPQGKALWSQTIKDLRAVELSPKNPSAKETLRIDGGFFSLPISGALEQTLQSLTYFQFCTFVETPRNRIQACSPGYSLNTQTDKWALEQMQPKMEDNVILVNGTEVNDHGIIQFDKNVKTVSLAATLASGLSVEVRTDYIELELLDIFYDEPHEKIHLKLREKNAVEKISSTWNSEISLKNPFLYVEALGQVPLRQEVRIIKDNLPLPSDRPELLFERKKTYHSSVDLVFKKKPVLSFIKKNKIDTLSSDTTTVTWTLNGLKNGPNKPRLLTLKTKEKTFTGAYEVERGPGWDLGLSVGAGSATLKSQLGDGPPDNTTSSLTLTQFYFQKYFDGLGGSYSPLHQLRWGVHALLQSTQSKETNDQEIAQALELSYRFNSNFHHSEGSFSLRGSWLGTKTKNTSDQYGGLVLTHDGPSTLLTSLFGDQHEAKLGLFPLCLNGDCKKTSLSQISWQSRYLFKKSFYWLWKLEGEIMEKRDGALSLQGQKIDFNLGLGINF